MERRTITMMLVGTGLFLAFVTFQGLFSSPADTTVEQAATEPTEHPADEQKAEKAGQEAKEITAEAAETKPDDTDEKTGAAAKDPELKPADDSQANDAGIAAQDQEKEPEFEQQYLTIGSLAADAPFEMMATLNNHAATVSRIELNDRLPSGKFRYQDLADHNGYLGHLYLTDDAVGCRVNVVGAGTPADLAKSVADDSVGLRRGDIIREVNGEPTDSVEKFREIMRTTRPRDSITISVLRDNRPIDFTAELTSRPLEPLRPEPEEFDDSASRPQDPESFQITVRKPGEANTMWSEFDPSLLMGNWQVVKSDLNQVVFEKRISAAKMAKIEGSGELVVRKIYRVASVPDHEEESQFPHAFHLFLDIEVDQIGGQPQEISLQVNGPTGVTTEGWWYTNKIHGEATGIGKAAGARDVILSTVGDSYSFFGGPEIFSKAISTKKDEKKTIEVFSSNSSEEQRSILYAGVDAQYFTTSMIHNPQYPPFVVSNMYLSPVHPVDKKDKKFRKVADISFRMYSVPIKLQPGSAYKQSFMIFAGPKEQDLLAQYGMENVRSFGWFAWFSKSLLWILHAFYFVFRNYGIAIILLTVLVRLAMTPISRKAALNAQMMQHLQPEMKKLAEKYKNDMEKRGQAQRELFRKYNYNPFGGCLLMFLQLPIFIGLYRGLSVDMALRDQPLIPGIHWCSNLAGPDQLLYWKDLIPIPWLTGETGWLGPYLNILPLITVVLFLVQQKLFTPPPTDEQQAMTQKMMTFMMLFIGLMFFKVPSGLCIYFITSSLWGICERKLLPKPQLDKSKLEELSDKKPAAEKSAAKTEVKKPAESKKGFFGLTMPKFNGKHGDNGSAEERKRRDKERQRRMREKRDE